MASDYFVQNAEKLYFYVFRVKIDLCNISFIWREKKLSTKRNLKMHLNEKGKGNGESCNLEF